ncbi:MAG: lipoate--protein ligase [Oscillospiraceae bacterium]|nr:lipoate--protein ligase [Oscillospiraceae bacterium]
MKLSYFDLTATDPAFNLATEEYIFESLPKDRMYLLLWQNDNAIIIGKHQNTLAQINTDFVNRKGIRVVRRLSGGGAVYHDMGNLNFTIIADAEGDGINFERFCDMVIAALRKAGIRAERNGRNDMVIDGKKFSGNAQYIKNGRVMHHGTLLFDSDMTVLSQALHVDPEKIQSKGIQSVRSRVTNIRPLLPEDMPLPQFRALLLESILEQYPGEASTLTDEDLTAIHKIQEGRYDTWQWNYGMSPECTIKKARRIEGCGTVEAYMTVTHGTIQSISLRGDFFGDPSPLEQKLNGIPLDQKALETALSGIRTDKYIAGLHSADLICLLCA